MIRIIFTTLLMIVSYSSIALDITTQEIKDQKNSQEQCEQIRLKDCLDQCDKTKVVDCNQLCEETSKNECLSAGE